MTREEIMEMDGQELCEWLNEQGVFSETNETIRQFYTNGSPIKWNLSACAFAARDYLLRLGMEYGSEFAIELIRSKPDCYKENDIIFMEPIDWLRAAALVIEERKENP